MSESTKLIVGLDIGTTKVCVIVGQRNENGKINVLGIGKAPSLGGVMRGEVTNITKTVDAIKIAVEQAANLSNVEINTVLVGIAGEHIRSFQHSGVKIRENSETEIMAHELEALEKEQHRLSVEPGSQILHVLPQEYRIDGRLGIKDPIGMTGTKLECNYHIITGRVTAAKTIAKCVENAGLQVADVVVEPIASASAVLSEEEMQSGIAILDIGGGTSDLAIFHDGKIRHTAVIPFGGEIITADIAEAFQIMEKQAELLKVKFGYALPEATKANEIVVVPGIGNRRPKEISTRNLSNVIHARIKEIIEMVYDEIVISGYKNKLNLGIVLTGGGAQLKFIDQLVEYVTGYEVKLGFPDQHLGKGLVEEVKSPMFATGIGLVIKGFEAEKENDGGNLKGQRKEAKEKAKGAGLFSLFGNFSGSFKNWLDDDQNLNDFK